MDKTFVIVSGLPGSGKSTISRSLSPLLRLPVIDKDDILRRLFDTRGVGDQTWRRTLSRESDVLFRTEAERSSGAILVSFWRLPGMPPDSGTPTGWLPGLLRLIVNLHCHCPPAIAAARFTQRRRHPGHLDNLKSPAEVLTAIQRIAHLGPLALFRQVQCDTSLEVELAALATSIHEALNPPP